MSPDPNSSDTRLRELQAGLLEQEHRVFFILWNLVSLLWTWSEKPAESRKAILKAFLWWAVGLFLPTSAGNASVLLVILGIAVAIWANRIAEHQNQLIEKQNGLIAQQSAIMKGMSSINRMDDVQNRLAVAAAGRPLDEVLHREVIGLSQSLVPYDRSDKSGRVLSPERGSLLRSLLDSPADTTRTVAGGNFSAASLRNARFQSDRPRLAEAHLERAVLDGALLTNANLQEAYLHDASLRDAILDQCDLTDADLSAADLMGANLRGADLRQGTFENTDFRNADLEGAKVDRLDWIEHVTKSISPPAKLEASKWRVESDSTDNSFRLRASASP